MIVLHTHWQPPHSPTANGGILFWAETSEGNIPTWQRGRLAQNPKPKEHPFCAPREALREILERCGRLASTQDGQAPLFMPTTRSGPQPSPRLAHAWELDGGTPPFLAPWIVVGLRLSPTEAMAILVQLLALGQTEHDAHAPIVLADDSRYWHTIATLALETLAAHKLVPLLVESEAGGKTLAHWELP
jgi:hypothetical protein